MPDISAAAWAVLTPLWVTRWALILGFGALPCLVGRLFAMLSRPLPGRFSMFRQCCAFIACVLSVWSLELAADTYVVESQQYADLQTKQCLVTRRARGAVDVACEDGTSYEQVRTGTEGASPRLYLLPNSGTPVYFGG